MKTIPKWAIPLLTLVAILMIDSIVYSYIDSALYSWCLCFAMFGCLWITLLLVAQDIQRKHPTAAAMLRGFVFLQIVSSVIIVGVFISQGISPVIRRG